MTYADSPEKRSASRWTTGILVVFMLLGIGFGSWLSRLPAVRDHLSASTLEMSVFGLVLALGAVTGLVLSGRSVTRLGPRRTLAIGVLAQALAMPAATILFWTGATVPAVVCLAVFGFSFSTCDVAMNVSGAAAERALGKPRMPLLHAGYSMGSVSAMGLGALAEAARIPVPIHLSVLFALIAAGVLLALRPVPRDEHAAVHGTSRETSPRITTHTGPVRIADAPDRAALRPPSRYNPWRDPRVLLIGVVAMSMSLAEGTASDWLPLALADGRGFSNAAAALTLGAFFVSMTLTRICGSWVLNRLGRIVVLRGGALLVIIGLVVVILVPFGPASVVGAVLWGVGCAFGFPVSISAAADDPATAVRSVAAVSAIAYTAFLLGPMMIGFLGEHFGLLDAFWPLVVFSALTLVFAGAARERSGARADPRANR